MDNPLLSKKVIEPREYQTNLYDEAVNQNTLIVLPTGLGKTIIAAMVIA
ncbi:MAG TPA: DEAD/DEAH box helicase family protein, partial [Thermoplasmataceae archaeon]|nr:DEAD/DEAH box helicase family protein [Thermoplasmataceae archaeon]